METHPYLQFVLDRTLYALPLSAVVRVIMAVMVSPLPRAPEIVLGVFNLSGRILPVVNIRRRFHLPEHPVEPADKFIIGRTSRPTGEPRQLALVVDDVLAVCEVPDRDLTHPSAILPGLDFLRGVARTDLGLVIIHDLGSFLALEEERSMDAALAERGE